MSTQTSIELGDTRSPKEIADDIAKALNAHGMTAMIGNWQVRNFHGYYQSREGGAGTWKFHVASFDSTSTGQAGQCTVMLVGSRQEDVPIDAHDRITVLGKKYGHSHWTH